MDRQVRREEEGFYPAFDPPLPGHPEPGAFQSTGVPMFGVNTYQDSQESSATPAVAPSRALGWLWQNLGDIRYPHILDCGPVFQATLDVLLKRGAKVYIGDLVTLARQSDSKFISRRNKRTVFLIDEFLGNLPPIPPDSLSVVACWHLLDLLPRDALPGFVAKLWGYIRPGGVLFCLLREPYLANGAEAGWWFDSLVVLGSSLESKSPFPHPALTNREVERLVPNGNVKTFLTRSARREILAIK